MFSCGSPRVQWDDGRSLCYWNGGGRVLPISLVPYGFLVQANGNAMEDRIVLLGWTAVQRAQWLARLRHQPCKCQ